MTKYYSLFGGMTTDTEIQVAQENQIVIDEGPGALTVRYVIYKVEHDADGYMYHMIDPDTKEIRRTDILQPYSQKFGIGMYYTDTPAEFMDASEVAILVGEAEQKAKEKSEAQARSQAEHDRIAAIGAERLERLMPADVKGVILAELNETRYTDPSYECAKREASAPSFWVSRLPPATASGNCAGPRGICPKRRLWLNITRIMNTVTPVSRSVKALIRGGVSTK